ncbi:MAG: dTMP kinase [Campylobacterales bacterium]|nr:dTMP kinase [Campylobacterales bacterium]
MYVIFEGVDTSGKSTQIARLKTRLPQAIITKEPGGTNLGIEIRRMVLEKTEPVDETAEMFLFLADRAQHYRNVVAAHADKLIVSDRGFVSGMAYAMANQKSLDLPLLLTLNRLALGGNFADKIVFFKTNEALILERLGQKHHDSIEARGIGYLLHVQRLMEEILVRLDLPVCHVDAGWSEEKIEQTIEGFLV